MKDLAEPSAVVDDPRRRDHARQIGGRSGDCAHAEGPCEKETHRSPYRIAMLIQRVGECQPTKVRPAIAGWARINGVASRITNIVAPADMGAPALPPLVAHHFDAPVPPHPSVVLAYPINLAEHIQIHRTFPPIGPACPGSPSPSQYCRTTA